MRGKPVIVHFLSLTGLAVGIASLTMAVLGITQHNIDWLAYAAVGYALCLAFFFASKLLDLVWRLLAALERRRDESGGDRPEGK